MIGVMTLAPLLTASALSIRMLHPTFAGGVSRHIFLHKHQSGCSLAAVVKHVGRGWKKRSFLDGPMIVFTAQTIQNRLSIINKLLRA